MSRKQYKFSDEVIPGTTFVTTKCTGRCGSVQLHTESAALAQHPDRNINQAAIVYTCQVCGSVKVSR